MDTLDAINAALSSRTALTLAIFALTFAALGVTIRGLQLLSTLHVRSGAVGVVMGSVMFAASLWAVEQAIAHTGACTRVIL